MPTDRRPAHRRRAGRWPMTLVMFLLPLVFAATVTGASAAFTATATNGTNSLAAAASFADYPTAVKAGNPLFYHRFDEAAGSITAADSSGNGLTGVHGADQATGAVWLGPFDEGSGSTANDLSGSATPKDLTLTNATWGTGRSGTVLSFNGTSAYGATSGAVVATNTSFSVSAWVYLTNTTTYRTAVSQDGTNMSGFYLQYHFGSNRWCMNMPLSDATSASGDLACSSAAPALNTWTHLTGVYDSTAATVKLYLNGDLQQSVPRTSTWNATGNLVVGGGKFTSRTDLWPGSIDEVRLYSGALGQSQVSELADGITSGPSTNFPLSENTGTTTADVSGNVNTGTFGTSATWTTGKAGSAVALDGTANAYVSADAPAVDTGTSFTVSAWAYLNGAALPSTNQAVVTQSGTRTRAFSLKYDSSHRWHFSFATADAAAPGLERAYSAADATLSTWTHLVGVYDSAAVAGEQIKLYVNGAESGVAARTGVWNATGSLEVGRAFYNSAYVDNFNGRIDDVRAYRRALSEAEVAVLYNGGAGNAPIFGHAALGQPGALQGAQQGQQGSTSASFSSAGNGYNPTRYSSPATFSMECWFQSSDYGGTIMDFGTSPDGNAAAFSRRLQLTTAGAVIFGSNSGTTNIIQSSTGYLDGKWHHVVATLNPTTGMALYLDGIVVGTLNYSTVSLLNGVWRWGGDTHNGTWPSPDYFAGRIDEVAVYGTALTAQQVSWHYHANH